MAGQHATFPTDSAGKFDDEALPLAAGSQRCRVLLPLPLAGPYDYLAPEGTALAPGDLVCVPLGRRESVGVVWDPSDQDDGEELPVERLKVVKSRIDLPPMTPDQRRFVDWVAAYTLTAPGAVLKMALSSAQALEPPPTRPVYRLVRPDIAQPSASEVKLTPARRRVMAIAADGMARSAAELAREAAVGTGVVKGLAAAGLLERLEMPSRIEIDAPDSARQGPVLSQAQGEAAAALRAMVDSKDFSVSLLDGVTGSGKTEVYMEAVAAALAAGRQVLVMLPEIALSVQVLERFEARFGAPPATWHSDMTQAQRRDTWRAVAYGEARVIVGARSALYLPFKELGLIVVDEEHEQAFKQEDGVAYHARDMAVVRASIGRFPAILVSATPSLESVFNVQQGRYAELRLPARHGGASLPDVEAVDLRRDKPERIPELGAGWLSPSLRQALAETLGRGEQALLFLNRRGYAPLTLCRACNHRLECPNCTALLVEHRLSDRLVCHHCGFTLRRPKNCPACGEADSLIAWGPGVERVAEEAAYLFPEARRSVLSSDTIYGPKAAAEFVRRVQEHEIDLLIGTQIVAKGHHFPQLTLVGVVDADLGLSGGDLRGVERTYQLLHQVSGRAGRESKPGRVLIQTHEPDHPVIEALVSGDRDRFFAAEAESRRDLMMPPFGRLAAVILSSGDLQAVEEVARALARAAPKAEGIQILGPSTPPLAALRGRHRRRFLVKTPRDQRPQSYLRDWLGRIKLPNRVRLQVDIDPYSFL
ncbi:primosomal protein N' [Limibacillus sp. MBR-115]|jgi:primosomal protein N' (replication factor Y)|uniref:primosomal protein N' n=1 Tax=Limibacillus sp. MBR-115 TaxID=3156465 RepID=UPI003396AECA